MRKKAKPKQKLYGEGKNGERNGRELKIGFFWWGVWWGWGN
jgi:hypothetical protein